MCGIAGYVGVPGGLSRRHTSAVSDMATALRHRGPDDGGQWHDHTAALAHRRLAIVDLSSAGQQPMVSANDRFVLTYNGELYNHQDLRAELSLAGVTFRGHSDTETLLEAIATWGLDRVLPRLNGIFAFGLWDRKNETLTLVRDRFGVKPVFWLETPDGLAFASELRAFHCLPDWEPQLSRDAVEAVLCYGFLPSPSAIFASAGKLEPGCSLTCRAGQPYRITRYWTPEEIVREGLSSPLSGTTDEIATQVETELRAAVERQLMSDVPLGAFLSGGIDSSLVVALMRELGSGPVRTFSIGFEHQGYDESQAARAVSRHLGTEHTEIRVSPATLLTQVDTLADRLDEPFGDASFLPTLLLSEAARKSVTVALSGDGGDELFAGYSRHLWARRLALMRAGLLGRGLVAVMGAAPARTLDRSMQAFGRWRGDAQFARKATKALRAVGAQDGAEMHRRFLRAQASALPLSRWHRTDNRTADAFDRWADKAPTSDPLALAQFLDVAIYMTDNVLTKVDRASMAASLEVRVPFLDNAVFDLSWRVPAQEKVRQGQGKRVLRHILRRHLPDALVDRPKAGFTVPLAEWFRGPLKGWAHETLFSGKQRHDTMLDQASLHGLFARHVDGTEDNSTLLWNALMLIQWQNRWMSADTRQKVG